MIHLDTIPGALNRDELSIGYNAYSIYKTGLDEHGSGPYPLAIQAFGEYKLPGLIYLTIPAIALFDLTPFAIRLPTALLGVLTIPILGLFIFRITTSRKISLVTMGLIATLPWAVHASRSAFEPASALPFFFGGLSLILIAQSTRKQYLSFLFGLGGAVVLGLAGWIYNSSFLLAIPSMIGILAWHWRSNINRIFSLLNISTLTLLSVILLGSLLSSWNVIESRTQTTLFDRIQFHEQAFQYRQAMQNAGFSAQLATVLIRPEYLQVVALGQAYFSAFSPSLLLGGDSNPWHSLTDFGLPQFPVSVVLLMLLGVGWLVYTTPSYASLLIGLLLFFPVTNGITNDAPIINRLL